MAGGDQGEFGAFEGTHAAPISPAPERVAKVGATAALVEHAIGDLVAQVERAPEIDQPSLMLDEMDEHLALFNGPVRHVAETIEASRRVRGRPKGSQNKNAFRDVLLRMGFRHPGLNLAAVANADPVKLALELAGMEQEVFGDRVKRMELTRDELSGLISRAYDMIIKANAELMPYFESKRPTEIDIRETVTGVMVFEEIKGTIEHGDDVVDFTTFPEPE